MAERDDVGRAIALGIASRGWHIVVSLATEAASGELIHAYTIGLTETCGHPEVVVYGLSLQEATKALQTVATQVKSRNQRFAGGAVYHNVFEGHRAAFRLVPAEKACDALSLACQRYGRGAFRALQLIWPDDADRFPWEEGYNRKYLALQPMLDSET